MRLMCTRSRHPFQILAVAVGVVVGCLAGPVAPSFAATQSNATGPTASGRDYLALGDSVTFGYRESDTRPPPDYSDPSSFIGYPEDVGAALGLHVANAACPGETSASLIVENVLSNGCENTPSGTPGYRTLFPLHVQYSGTQLQYAVQYLRNHPSTRLVSLMVGANDVFLCEATTTDRCAGELAAVLKQISFNVADILSVLRDEAGYHGAVVIVDYYSLNYASRAENEGSLALNQAMNRAAKPFHVVMADGFTAFRAAARQSGGNTCTAGLLTQLTSGGCGVHPSLAGQALLALAVERAIRS